jgi:hypothetical protein
MRILNLIFWVLFLTGVVTFLLIINSIESKLQFANIYLVILSFIAGYWTKSIPAIYKNEKKEYKKDNESPYKSKS